MENPQKQKVAERVKQANNILVTVSNNPSVDQLAACIGLTLALNRMGKHATAVFSGEVPSTLAFLQPEKTIEKNTDSLRDFIIALDKSKADKLRYKVEDKVVKIFITPYRTSISDKDLQFSQGDFNVDVVLALGVHNQRELDQAITAHGRILHDAAVITVNVKPGGEFGALNWLDPKASSLSELSVQLVDVIDKRVIDSQIATALLTGIVAETQRFSNNKTSPLTMSFSAELMTAGANQQLVSTKLEEKPKPPTPPPQPPQPQPASVSGALPGQPKLPPAAAAVGGVAPPAASVAPPQPKPKPVTEGVLEIPHEEDRKTFSLEDLEEDNDQPYTPKIEIDQEGTLRRLAQEQQAASGQNQGQPEAGNASTGLPTTQPSKTPQTTQSQSEQKIDAATDPTGHMASSRKILQPPSAEPNQLTAGAFGEDERDGGRPPIDPLTGAPAVPPLRRESEQHPGATLSDIERRVGSPHVQAEQSANDQSNLANARSAVDQASRTDSGFLPPTQGLGSQPLGQELHDDSGKADNTGNQPQHATLPPPSPPPFMPPAQK